MSERVWKNRASHWMAEEEGETRMPMACWLPPESIAHGMALLTFRISLPYSVGPLEMPLQTHTQVLFTSLLGASPLQDIANED